MKRIACLSVVLFLIRQAAIAQHTDTAFAGSKLFASDSVAVHLYRMATASPFYIRELMPRHYNTLSIGYGYEKGKYIPAQGSTGTGTIDLTTEGKTVLKDVHLWGLFNLKRISEDSTRFAHQTRNDVSVPYYFGSPAYVSYRRKVYNLRGAAERNMLRNNLPLSLGIDYRIGDHYSANDPRGAVSDFQLGIVAAIGYTFFDRLKIGAAYRYGYGQERVNVGYKNMAYFESSAYPRYTNYVVSGYGEPIVKNLNRNYQNNQKRNGGDAYISLASPWGLFMLNTTFLSWEQRFVYKSLPDMQLLNYNLDMYTADLVWSKAFRSKKLMAVLSYANTDGKDHNFTYNANNYLYNYNRLSGKILLTDRRNSTIFNYTLHVEKHGEERVDGIHGNRVSYNRIAVSAGFGITRQAGRGRQWGIAATPVYSTGLNDLLELPASSSGYFTNEVIYHDYYYNTSAYTGGDLAFDYSMPAYNRIQAAIRLGIGYTARLDMQQVERPEQSAPGKDRVTANISLNLFF